MVKRYEDWDNEVKSIQASGVHIQLSFKSPLILCIVSRHPYNLNLQLEIVFNQILSILSKNTLDNSYKKHGHQFDVRRWLDGIDKRINACVRGFIEDPVVFSSGFRILPVSPEDREYIVNLMATSIEESSTKVCLLIKLIELLGITFRMLHLL